MCGGMVDVDVELVVLVVLVDVVGGGDAMPVVKLQPELGGVNDVGLLEGVWWWSARFGAVVVVDEGVAIDVVVVEPEVNEVVVTASVVDVDVLEIEVGGAVDAADKSMARKRNPPTATVSTKRASTTRSGHRRGVVRFLSSLVISDAPYVSGWPGNSQRRITS